MVLVTPATSPRALGLRRTCGDGSDAARALLAVLAGALDTLRWIRLLMRNYLGSSRLCVKANPALQVLCRCSQRSVPVWKLRAER
jgi:hypothetical protein